VRVDVAFTPAEKVSAHVGIVVDVIRATSSIAQALASGYERVLCCAEIDEVALMTSTTMPTCAETCSAGVNATSTRTPIR
jgi:phosphosulfolactate phosphohydrolase-like enzyme